MAKSDSITIRVSPNEKFAWEVDAKRRGMELSRWLRSAAATFCVCGKNTVTVPAGDVLEPAYVANLRAEIAEVKRLTLELQERTSVYEKLSVAHRAEGVEKWEDPK